MPASALTGSRIRERRIALGLKQSALAQTVEISPAYLNLIEHNRRRIGGKLLTTLARALDVDAGQLAEGAEATLVAALREAAASVPEIQVDRDRADDLAGQFPRWADVLVAQYRRIVALEHTVESLNDRMAHDPHLAASLHDILSTVTAINAAASILVDTRDIEGEWRDRFHRNIFEDSTRLSEGAQALVGYLENAAEVDLGATLPQDEVGQWLEAKGYHLPELERALPADPDKVVRDAPSINSNSAKVLARRHMDRYRADAVKMPLGPFRMAAEELQFDPVRLAQRFGTDMAAVLRRIATLPQAPRAACIGLVCCDGSGTLTFRKPVDGFALPRFGAACPLWPLYQALGRPMTPLRAMVELAGRDPVRFLTYAIAGPVGASGFDAPPVIEATMLILPVERAQMPDLPVQRIGSSCRICPRQACDARREPSIMAAGV